MQKIFTHQVGALFAASALDINVRVSQNCLFLCAPAQQKDALVEMLETGILHAVHTLDPTLSEFAINGDRPQQIGFWLSLFQPSEQVRCLMRGISLTKTLLDDARSNGKSTFQVDFDGHYLQAHLSKSADPPCSSTAMIGATLHSVIGVEGGAILLSAIRDAISSGEQRAIAYPGQIKGERRWYFANIHPRDSFAELIVSRAYCFEGSVLE